MGDPVNEIGTRRPIRVDNVDITADTWDMTQNGYITRPPMDDYGVTNPVALCFLLWRLQIRRLRLLTIPTV